MSVKGATEGGAALFWRAVPPLLSLAVGAAFLAQVGGLHGPEAVYPAVLAAVLVVISGYNLVRSVLRRPAPVTAPAPAPAPARVAAGTAATAPHPDREVGEAGVVGDAGEAGEAGEDSDAGEEGPDRLTFGRPVAIIAILVLTLILITSLGFFVAAPVLILGALAVTGVRRPRSLIIAGVGIWAAAYLVFGVILNVPLPTGIWW